MRSSLRRAFSTVKEPLWRPSRERAEASQLSAFADGVAARHGDDALVAGGFGGRAAADYDRLHAWSCARPAAFWDEVWRFVDYRASAPYGAVVAPADAPWFDPSLDDAAARARARGRARRGSRARASTTRRTCSRAGATATRPSSSRARRARPRASSRTASCARASPR